MLAATIASHCNLNQYPLGDRCLWLRGRIVLPTLIIMAATATDGVRDSMELDATAAAVQNFMQHHTQLAGAPLKSVASQIKEVHVIVTPLPSIVIVAKPGSKKQRRATDKLRLTALGLEAYARTQPPKRGSGLLWRDSVVWRACNSHVIHLLHSEQPPVRWHLAERLAVHTVILVAAGRCVY